MELSLIFLFHTWITSIRSSLSWCSLCNQWYGFILPALSLCVMVWIDSLHTQCQGHHQGLMNERWKEVKVEQPPRTCKRLISLLHYHASAAGTGFNSSSLYHWATAMVNLDYLLYVLPKSSITRTCPVQQPGNQISSKSWPGGFTWNVLSRDEAQPLDNLRVS